MGHRLTTCHNREIAKFPIAPTKNPYFIVRGIARKGSNQARSVEVGWPAYEAALQEHGKTYTAHIYPGVNHGFHNDSTPRYDEAAAELAWDRTIAFFNEHLK